MKLHNIDAKHDKRLLKTMEKQHYQECWANAPAGAASMALRAHRLTFAVAIAACMAIAGCAGTGPSPQASVQQHIVVDSAQRPDVVMAALGLLDTRYQYGGISPATGFDCSGLVAYVFRQAAEQSLPHNTDSIARLSRPVARSQLQSGDFVFFNTLGRPNSHMGIYVGDGRFINAPSSGGRVRIDSLQNPYFAKRFESARTLFAS